MIVTLTGVSASGKTTIEKGLRANLGTKPVVSETTRLPDKSDLIGNYNHHTREEFLRMKDAGELIWWFYLFGNYYGTAFKSLQETALEPDTIFVMVLEPDNIRTLWLFGKRMNIQVASFYILSPPPKVLRERFQKRGRETAEQVEKRIAEAADWDERALNSGIPYTFIKNDDYDPEAKTAVSTVITEIVHRISA